MSKATKAETVIVRDYLPIEAKAVKYDKGGVEFWLAVYNDFLLFRGADAKLSVNKFATEWQAQVKTRSAKTVNNNLSTIKKASEAGWDVSSFVSMDHVVEVLGRSSQAGRDGLKGAAKVAKELESIKELAELLTIEKALKARIAAVKAAAAKGGK